MRIFLSYSHHDEEDASAIYKRLAMEGDFDVTMDVMGDLAPYDSPKAFMESVRLHDAVVQLVSRPFLQSKSCMRELLNLMKDDTERDHYLQRTVPVIKEGPSEHLGLFTPHGQLEIVEYWVTEYANLQKELSRRGDAYLVAVSELREELVLLRDISESVMRYVRALTDHVYVATFAEQEGADFADVVERLDRIRTPPESQAPAVRVAGAISSPRGMIRSLPASSEAAAASESPPSEQVRLQAIYERITNVSTRVPGAAEYPPLAPRFPATPTTAMHIRRLKRDVFIKDESQNATGTHKDRMAWEIVVYYKTLIGDLLAPSAKVPVALPAASIISNGSAALAIQTMLAEFGLPPLKVLIDRRTERFVIKKLRGSGCEVYEHDLAARELSSEDVLSLTENEQGFDVTSRSVVDPTRRKYYDWLAYEILNQGARHIFVPVGTGDLLVNLLTVVRDELEPGENDKRLLVDAEQIRDLTFYGATSHDPNTKMDKLYAAYRPTLREAERLAADMRDRKLCLPRTSIYGVDESLVNAALELARVNQLRSDASGIAGLALFLQLSGDIPIEESVLVVNTGWFPRD